MKVDKDDWHFDVDFQKTQLMYLGRVKSGIDAKKQPTELVSFVSELGIDIEKPDKVTSDFSDAIYTCMGSAKSETGYEIDIYGEEQFISIVVSDRRDRVELEVFGMTL